MDAATFLRGRKASSEEPTIFRDTTPSGIVVEYQAQPKRLYRVNGIEVPSVTTVLDVLAKDGLKFWGQDVGVRAILELFRRGKVATKIDWHTNEQVVIVDDEVANPENLKALITAEKLSCNHVLNSAADRGTNVHDALEQWAWSGGEFFPTPQNFPKEERGYVEGLLNWLTTGRGVGSVVPVLCEVMVGSVEHGFAGRYDLVVDVDEPLTFVRRAYKRKENLTVEVNPGRYLVDLKTSKSVYPGSHFRQLAAYELASVECGYPKTDGQFVLHVTADGVYEFVPSTATAEDFLAVLEVWRSNGRLK